MRGLFIAFWVGICCFLSACDVRTSSNQEPIIINWDIEPVELPEEVYVNIIEKDKQAVGSKLETAETHKNLGVSYLESGKLDKAIVEFKRAVQIDPSFVEAHYLLADVYSLKGIGVLSRKSLETAMALEGSYIIDTTIGAIDRTHTIIESTPPAVIRSEESIERTFPPEFFEDPVKIDVPRKWESRPK